jgi:hypothetical protein
MTNEGYVFQSRLWILAAICFLASPLYNIVSGKFEPLTDSFMFFVAVVCAFNAWSAKTIRPDEFTDKVNSSGLKLGLMIALVLGFCAQIFLGERTPLWYMAIGAAYSSLSVFIVAGVFNWWTLRQSAEKS